MGVELFEKIAERYPFITFCTYAGNEYVGVIQNRDDQITTIYDFGGIVNDILEETNAGKFADNTADLKQLLMEYYNEFIQNGKVQCNNNNNIKKYTRNIMAKKYSELLDALVENKI